MSFFQLIYTSCKTGIFNKGSGFQVYSYSKDMDDNLVKEIERNLCYYKEPYNLPSAPTSEEIENLFPKVFSYFNLENNSKAITNCKYIGRDYMGESGRFGNYISHTYVTKSDIKDIYSIEYYNSNNFIEKIDNENVNNEIAPDYLDERENIEIGNINRKSVSEFIKNKDIEFCKLVDATIECIRTKKRILINDDNKNIPYWIAAIQMSFPKKIANNIITFTTYDFDPERSDYLISGVIDEGTRCNIKAMSGDRRFYIFDFKNNLDVELENSYKFSKFARINFEDKKGDLRILHDFLIKFQLETISDIEAAYNAYQLIELLNIKDLEIDELIVGLKFIEEQRSKENIEYILNRIINNKEIIVKDLDIERFKVVIEYLVKFTIKFNLKNCQKEIYKFIFETIHEFLVEGGEGNLENVENLYKDLKNIVNRNDMSLQEYLISKECLDEIYVFIKDDYVYYHNEFYINLVISEAIGITKRWTDIKNNEELIYIYNAILDNIYHMTKQDLNKGIELMIARHFNNSKLNVGFLLYLLNDKKQFNTEDIIKSYIRYINENSLNILDSIFYELIEVEKQYELAYHIYIKLNGRVNDFEKVFWLHFKKYVLKNEKYFNKYGNKVVANYITYINKSLNGEKLINEYCKILNIYINDLNDTVFTQKIIDKFEVVVPLNKPNQELKNCLLGINKYKEDNKIADENYKLDILYFGNIIIDTENICYKKLEIIKQKFNTINLEKLTENEYKDLISWTLIKMIDSIKTVEDHGKILYLLSYKNNDVLVNKYMDIVFNNIDYEKKNKIDIISTFTIFYLKELRGILKNNWSKTLVNDIDIRFGNDFKNKSKKILKYIDDEVKSNKTIKESELAFWIQIYNNAIESKENIILNKIKSIFKINR